MIKQTELKYLLGGVLLLAALNFLDFFLGKPFWGITRMIHLGYDDNFSAWYSSMLFVIAGLISYSCFMVARKEQIKDGIWLLLFSVLLFILSADEISRFHEILGGHLSDWMGVSDKKYAQHSNWVWVGGPIVIAIFAAFAWRLKNLVLIVPKSMFFLVIGFTTIILGGVVLESTTNFLNHKELQWVWDIEVIFEEILEMCGTLFIAYALVLWKEGVIKEHS